jgi:hypothetical protein
VDATEHGQPVELVDRHRQLGDVFDQHFEGQVIAADGRLARHDEQRVELDFHTITHGRR